MSGAKDRLEALSYEDAITRHMRASAFTHARRHAPMPLGLQAPECFRLHLPQGWSP